MIPSKRISKFFDYIANASFIENDKIRTMSVNPKSVIKEVI